VLGIAEVEADRNKERVDTSHILGAIMLEGQSFPAHVLRELGVAEKPLSFPRLQAIRQFAASPECLPDWTDEALAVLPRAVAEAVEVGCDYVATEHLLLALLHFVGTVAEQKMRGAGIDYARVRKSMELFQPGWPKWNPAAT
jgi:ATP-dependent Clp protease ATP-binding subunit ClpA